MVQILKEELKESILISARQEFIRHGFLNASMRTISKNSKCALGNIYNYFENKDAIFKEVVSPALNILDEIKTGLDTNKELNYLKLDKSEAYFEQIVDFLDEHRENLKLIAFNSYGSKLQNYTDEWIEHYSRYEYAYLRKKAKEHKDIFKNIPSKFFIRNLSGFFFKTALELVNQDLPKDKLASGIEEIFGFVYQGWGYYAEF